MTLVFMQGSRAASQGDFGEVLTFFDHNSG